MAAKMDYDTAVSNLKYYVIDNFEWMCIDPPKQIAHIPTFSARDLVKQNGRISDCHLCALCRRIPSQPINFRQSADNCTHIYCEPCYSLERQRGCRDCRSCQKPIDLGYQVFEEWTPEDNSVLNSLIARCPCGCPIIASVVALGNHVRHECENRHVRCPNLKCYWVGKHKSLIEEHLPKCIRYVDCGYCGTLITEREMPFHRGCGRPEHTERMLLR